MESAKKPLGKSRKAVVIIACVLALLLALCYFIGNYFYGFALARKGADYDASGLMSADGEAPANEPDADWSMFEKDEEWLSNVGCDDAYIKSADGLRLHAYVIDDPGTNKYVVICHGYTSSAESMLGFAKRFYELGYGCLVPDARGHGLSEGDYIGMGWHERLDMTDWCEWLCERAPECDIALYGISMGGATVMMASGEELPANVKAIVEDCGYSSIRAEFEYQLKRIFKLPSFPVLNLASIVTRMRAGYSIMREGDAAAQVAKANVPILFIHGGEDTFVPTDMVYVVYAAAVGEKELLVVDGAAHGMASAADPELYFGTVEEFLNKHIG